MNFKLSSCQKMLLFSEINNANNDSFYLKFRKDYPLDEFEYLKSAVEIISKNYLNLQITKNTNGDFEQYYAADTRVNLKCFEVSENDVESFIKDYLDKPFEEIFDTALYSWVILKTQSNAILIGAVQHILLDGTSLYTLLPQEIETAITCLKNNTEYQIKDYSYEEYVNSEIQYLQSVEAEEDKKYWLNSLKNYTQDWYSFDNSHLGYRELILDEIPNFNYSPFVTALSLGFLYLSKSKNDNATFNDIVMNTSVHGRYFGQDDALGMFVNTIPLRLAYDEELSFEELLAYSKSVLKEGLSHAKLQFSEYTTDLRNADIDPNCISMYSIVSNSTNTNSKFLTLQKDINFPFHIRVNKNYDDVEGLQSLFIEYDKACFEEDDIECIVKSLEDLLKQVCEDPLKKCKDYDVDIADFFAAENYYNNLINSFDAPTVLSPDNNSDKAEYKMISRTLDSDNLEKLASKYGLTSEKLMLAIGLYNLSKFSFSKDILITYNKLAAGYHFNTDMTVEEFLNDFNRSFKEYPNYPLANNEKLDFDSEIVYCTEDIDCKDYKFAIIHENNDLKINYDSSYYSKELAGAFLDAYEVLLDKFNSDKSLLKNISICAKIDEDDDFKMELANTGVVKEMFEQAVTSNPNKTILYADDGQLTYDELNRKSNKIANALIKKGVGVNDNIMFMMRRNSDLIAAVLAIAKTGAAFIPIDPKYPKNRINQILEDSSAKYVITSSEIEYAGENGIDVGELLKEDDDSNPQVNITPDDVSFLIYTSGSTGKPKGVMITNRGITNYIANVEENVPIYQLNKKCSKFISISTVSFIVFLREIFGTIMNGLPVVFANDEESIDPIRLSELFDKSNADGFGSTPTRLLEYLKVDEIQEVLSRCEVIIVGGEGFPPVLYDRMSKYTRADIYNSYGPTEVTIASHYKLIDSPFITAGWPMLNVVDKIMDIDQNQLPPYVTGEIYVGGAGIAKGYLNNPEQTKEVFKTINNIPYYNTGDLGRKDNDGELYVLGRNDNQIKLRGLRIELSEIEWAIANYEDIILSKVMVKKLNSIEYLCAYFTSTGKVNTDKLTEYLKETLPEYMVPSYFTQLDEFPKTPNGKVDFKSLPDPEIDVEELIQPRNKVEKEITDIVSAILQHHEFGVNTDLFTVGLTSLSVIQLVTSLSEKFGSQITVTDVLKYKSIEKIAKELKEDNEDFGAIKKYYPLTQNQLGVYFDYIKNPDSLAYNLPKKLEFKNIDADKLKSSIIKAVNNHPYLKTIITPLGGQISQQRRDELEIDEYIEIVDEYDVEDFVKPFKLDEGPLFRFKIIKDKMLLADFHHILVDGTSLNILFDEIAKIYDGKDYELEDINGFDYSLSEVKKEESSIYQESKEFFENKIKEFDEASVITQDLNGDETNAKVAIENTLISKSLIDDFCSENRISQNNLFLAASSFTLSKFVYSKDLLFATLSNGRFNSNIQKTLAMMVKTLPLALKLDTDLNIKEFFEYINGEWLNVLTYSAYPLTKLSEDYDIAPEILFAYHGKIINDVEMGNQIIERQSIDYDSLKFKINLYVVDIGDEYKITCEYNDQLYSQTLMETFLSSLEVVLNKFTKLSSETKIKDISIVEDDSLPENIGEYDDFGEVRLNKLFEKQVDLNPDKVILYADDGEFTYEELNIKANRIAHALIKKGVGLEDRVMLILNRNSNLISSVYGILKAGAGFIPVDSDYPSDRIEHVLTDSQSKYIIVDDVIDKKGIDLSEYADKLLDVNELLEENDISNPDQDIQGNNLAYIIYTSGSTGLPKGVMLEHANIANFVYPDSRNISMYELVNNLEAEDYKVLSTTTVAFDVFQQELMGSLLNSVPMVFANDVEYKDPIAMAELVNKTGANVYVATPSRILQYLEIDELREIMCGFKVYLIAGEAFPLRLYEVLSKNSSGKIYNMYGPTEATVYSNGSLLTSSDISIGKPLFNVHECIMDYDFNPLPANVVGELCISGKGVSREYLNHPEKNAESYKIIDGIKFYKTGDYAKLTEDGEVYVYGRMDNQIKLRGLRIEIGEIESAIADYDPIKSVVVVVKKINENDYLCAYYTLKENYENLFDLEYLKDLISKKLVYYMVPTFYMQLDEFPRTPNDKIDVRKLPEIEIQTATYTKPSNEIEEGLFEIAADIIGIEEFGVESDLLTLGLTSLSVMKFVSEIHKKFNTSIMLTEVMKHKTIKEIAKLINPTQKDEVEIQETYPLTQNQLGVYFECVKNPEDVTYNMPLKLDFNGKINTDKLKNAIITAIDNHPYLKTRIIMKEGEAYQERRDNLEVENHIEITSESEDIKEFVKPFKLDEGPLFRFKIINDSLLLADFHHIIADGTALKILFDEIASIYDGRDYELEEIDGFEYALNEVKTEQSNLYKEAELFFFNKIKEFDEATLITPDLNGNQDEGWAVGKRRHMDKEMIDEVCQRYGMSQNNLFLSVTSFVLSKFASNKNLLFATLSNGRYDLSQQKTLAMMVKTLPLALKLNTDLNIKEYFEFMNNEWMDVLTYSSYPLTKISDKYSIMPEILYTYQSDLMDDMVIDGKSVKKEFIEFDHLKFNMGIEIEEKPDQYDIFCQYNNEMYSDKLIGTFLDSFEIVLNKFSKLDNDTQLKDIAIIENDNLGIDDVKYDDIGENRLNKLFEKQVEMNPNKIVLQACDGDYSYEELNIKANKIANNLIKNGVGVEDKVMIILNRNSNFIASVFGILKAGAAFIPIDSEYPKDRIEHILTDSQSKYIIVDDVIDKKYIDLSEYADKLLDINELLEENDISNPNQDIHGDNLAYIIYTSGSTGLPKGVMLEHENIANFVYPDSRNISTYELVNNLEEENYKVLSTTTVAFDVFQQELMGSLLNSIPMVFASDDEYKDPIEMAELVNKTGANVYVATPSRILQYLEIDELKDMMYGFKVYLIAGEPFPQRLYEALSKNSSGKIFNMYGPTETTVYSNGSLLTSSDISIGKPLFNVHECIMDYDSNPLPPNVIGELYISGKGVSREYLNRPEKNAESYEIINGIKFYKTGDYAKLTEDGNFYVYGRMDNQIKLRGLRIEIGEIESAIADYDPIKSVVVVVKKIKDNDHLCAYFTVQDEYKKDNLNGDEYSFDIDDLKKKLNEKLVYYMVPTVYTELDEMPQTPNGKTDVRNLPEPKLITKYVAPENDAEAYFVKTFEEILGLDKVSVTDNFFEIGGTSLLVTKITMAAINRNYKVSYGDVFNNPTPRMLAEFISNDDDHLSQTESKYDYTKINNLLKNNTVESFNKGKVDESLGDVLLTGATGFLGVHVLKELIESEQGKIYCLLRSKKDLHAADRLKTLLFYYFSESFEDLFDDRIVVVEGDITNYDDFEKMINYNINTIINCAANVKHFSSGNDIEEINYNGVINGLKFAKIKNSKYVQISTYSVAGQSLNNYPPVDVKFTEQDLFIGQLLENQYINSKFLAERAVLEARIKDDLNVKIMRVGNLMARSSDSEFQINFETNGFVNRLKSFVTLGKIQYSKLGSPVEFSAIDITAKAIVELAKAPKECTVFHAYDEHTASFADVIKIINKLDLHVDPCDDEEYEKALEEAFKDKSKQDGLSGIITNVGQGQTNTAWLGVENKYTLQILYRLGVFWPMISEEYIYTFIKYLQDIGFFDL